MIISKIINKPNNQKFSIMVNTSQNADKFIKVKEERSKHVETILASKSKTKVVVAGPGTGKTYLFGKILEDKKNALTLTFINSLVEDLSLELCGISEVKTLHSYARSILSQITGKRLKIFSKLTSIIKEDAEILISQEVNYARIFNERDETVKNLLDFYKKRRQYYNFYGFSDIIYTAVLYFESSNDKIPAYDQIVVDEFQDFNRLEVDLIDLLAEKSPILLTGDDDQALYQFKSSSNQYIRERYSQIDQSYEPYNLPYCTRCTRVVVDATNDLITSAKNNGFLKRRIEKPFIYFDHPDKDKISERYPKVGYAQVYAKQIPWFIETKIAEMAKDVKDKFSVLIISPYKKQTKSIGISLKTKGLQNIDYEVKDDTAVTIMDGFKLLIEDKQDNLGWRIVLKFLCSTDEFNELLKTTDSSPDRNIIEIVSTNQKKRIKKLISILNYVKKNKTINDEDFEDFLRTIQIDSKDIAKSYLRREIESNIQPSGIPAIRKIPIKATTIQSSKGLSGDLVFITHFDDQYFIQNDDKTKISDQDICNFLVSLSRTKKKLYLVSSTHENPIFFDWISKDRLEIIKTI